MGGKSSKRELPEEDLQFLLEVTAFTEEQIKEWFKGYMKDCPSGLLSRKKFLDIYSTFFPDGKAKGFYEHVFRTFDSDNSGKIDFKEFLQAINITQCGKPEDKLELAFRLYDIDGSGSIEEDEMAEIMKAIYSMVGKEFLMDSPKRRTKEIFHKMDENNDGSLTKEEFIKGCMADQTLFELLTCTSDVQENAEDEEEEEEQRRKESRRRRKSEKIERKKSRALVEEGADGEKKSKHKKHHKHHRKRDTDEPNQKDDINRDKLESGEEKREKSSKTHRHRHHKHKEHKNMDNKENKEEKPKSPNGEVTADKSNPAKPKHHHEKKEIINKKEDK